MIAFGYLRISVTLILILGWAIFVHNLCVPRQPNKPHASKTVIGISPKTNSTVTNASSIQTGTIALASNSGTLTVKIATSNPTRIATAPPTEASNTTGSSLLEKRSAQDANTTKLSTQSPALNTATPTSIPSDSHSVQPNLAQSHSLSPTPSAGSTARATLSTGNTSPVSPGLKSTGGSLSSASTSSSSSSSSSAANAVQGSASYYTEWKSNPGSCGFIPTNGNIAAVNAQFMPAKCKQCILINYNGKQLKVQATDTCPGCSATKIDLSDVAFQQLDSLSKGILQISWSWVPC